MTSRCIYRNNKAFAVCSKVCGPDSCFCMKHKNMQKQVYEIFYNIIGRKEDIHTYDIYQIFKYMQTCADITEEMQKLLFIEVLKKIPRGILSDIFLFYFDKGVKGCKGSKGVYDKIYELNKKTYEIGDENASKIQKIMKQWFVKKMMAYDVSYVINNEDPFTYDSIDEIDRRRLFVFKEGKTGAYAFDAVELCYFVEKCKKEGIICYNPFTRKVLDSITLCRLNMFINYNGLEKKAEYMWQTEGQAFTDLSMEIEKQGFYNSPDWFMKMDKKTLIKVIKLFKDFSGDIRESQGYFLEFKKDTFVFDFCKEGIRLFSECNEGLYILCCNFIKALAMYSRDFYMNMPEWLANMNTSSRISEYARSYGTGFNMYNGYNGYNSDNFLLYYYVEYMQ